MPRATHLSARLCQRGRGAGLDRTVSGVLQRQASAFEPGRAHAGASHLRRPATGGGSMKSPPLVGCRSGRATPALRATPPTASRKTTGRGSTYRNRNGVPTKPTTSEGDGVAGVIKRQRDHLYIPESVMNPPFALRHRTAKSFRGRWDHLRHRKDRECALLLPPPPRSLICHLRSPTVNQAASQHHNE